MTVTQLPVPDADEILNRAPRQLDSLEASLARLANAGPLQTGRIPERLGRAAALIGDARDLVADARREWIEL